MKPFNPPLKKSFKCQPTNCFKKIRGISKPTILRSLSAILLVLFSGYFSFSQFNTNGNATALGGDCFRLTPALRNQSGSVWFQNKISLASDLTINATINLGNRTGVGDGADGLAFVLQPVCSGLGTLGGGIGYQGITPSLAVEFDTYQNGDRGDPAADHIGLMKNGNVNHNGATAAPIQVLQNYKTVGELEDGNNHTLLIQWTASTQNLKITLDGVLQVNYTNDIVANIFSGNRNVFWGFTAATGLAFNNQSVCILSSAFTEEGSFTVTKPTCPNYNNGAIDLNPAGGIGPFTYAWAHGPTTEDVSGLSAGTYNVTVTDGNGCQSKFSIVVANEVDAELPVITCPGNLSVFSDPGNCSAVVPFGITPVVNYDPTGPQGSPTPNPPDFQAAGVVATNLSQIGFEAFGNGDVWPVGRITSSPTVLPGEYLTFSVNVPGGTDFANLVYDKFSYFSSGASLASIRSSLDGFASDITTIPVNPSGFQKLIFDLSSLPNVSGNIEFRIYLYGAPGDRVDFDDLISSARGGTGLTLNRFLTATATDNCTGVTVAGVRSDALPLSNPYPVGTTTITYTATDASGNTASCTQTITVTDKEVPVITTNGNQNVNNAPGTCGAAVTVSASATDNCSVGAPTGVRSDGLSLTAIYPVGTTTITWNVTDANGNAAVAVTQTVTVNDTEKPKAICKPVTVTLVNGTASVTATMVNNGSTDNCGIASLSVSPATFSCSNIGNNNVMLTVTDVNGNVSTCNAVVTVTGEIPSCSIASIPSNNTYTGGVPTNLYIGYGPQSTTLQVSTPASGAPYTYAWSGGTLSNYNTANPVFTATTAGSFTFTVQVTNKFGCKTTCSITICVLDIRVPGTDGKKVYVCHVPPGNPGNAQTIEISVNAVSTHIFNPGHGDHLGTCEQTPCASATMASFASAEKSVLNTKDAVTSFKVTVSPNPTLYQFTIRIQSNVETPVSIRILNSIGQVVEGMSKVNANTTVNMGGNLRSGAYMAEVVQGNERKMVRLVKLN